MQISMWLAADYFTVVNAYQLMPIIRIKIIFWVTIKPLLFRMYGYVTIFYHEKHSCSQKQKWFRQNWAQAENTVGSSGLAEESTHPQTVRTFLSFIAAPIARRESELPCPSKRDLWQVQVQSASEVSPSHASSHLSCNHPQNRFKLPLPVSKHRQAASCLWHQVQKNKTN